MGGIQTLGQHAKALEPSQMRNVITGKTVVDGRGVWALNNTPKNIKSPTSTVGNMPKTGKLEVGEFTGDFERTVGYKIDPATEQFEAIKSFDRPFTVTKDGVVYQRMRIYQRTMLRILLGTIAMEFLKTENL